MSNGGDVFRSDLIDSGIYRSQDISRGAVNELRRHFQAHGIIEPTVRESLRTRHEPSRMS